MTKMEKGETRTSAIFVKKVKKRKKIHFLFPNQMQINRDTIKIQTSYTLCNKMGQ